MSSFMHDYAEFVALATRNAPTTMSAYTIADTCRELSRLAKRAERNAENLCNVPNATDKRDSLRISAKAMAAVFGWYAVKISGDPRGSCLGVAFTAEEAKNDRFHHIPTR